MPDFFAENRQVNLVTNPRILLNGMFDMRLVVDENDNIRQVYKLSENPETLNIKGLFNKYVLRFGSSLFLLFLWNENIDSTIIRDTNIVIERMFPYNLLSNDKASTIFERCTHAYNYHHIMSIDSYMGIEIADSSNCFIANEKKAEDINKELSVGWNEYVRKTRSNFKDKKIAKNNLKKRNKNKKKQEKTTKK